MIDKTNFDDLLKAGMSKNRISVYLGTIEKENESLIYDEKYRVWAHSHGFWVRNACYYNLNESNIGRYLSDYDYNLIWPLNNWERIWINDKLTLKLILEGTKWDSFMPKYYYYSTPDGLRELSDSNHGNSFESFVTSLREHKMFACKPNNGSGAQGFNKMSFNDGCFYIDDRKVELEIIRQFIESHPNYVFTEFLLPHRFFAKYNPLIHTIRVNTLNIHGDDPIIFGEWVRVPTIQTKVANNASLETKEKFNVISWIDSGTGKLEKTVWAYADRYVEKNFHPDTNTEISGFIPNHDQLVDFVLGICRKFNTLELMGFDVGLTENGFKLMEINSHPGIMYDQLFNPWMEMPVVGDYFRQRIDLVNSLSDSMKEKRNNIQR